MVVVQAYVAPGGGLLTLKVHVSEEAQPATMVGGSVVVVVGTVVGAVVVVVVLSWSDLAPWLRSSMSVRWSPWGRCR